MLLRIFLEQFRQRWNSELGTFAIGNAAVHRYEFFLAGRLIDNAVGPVQLAPGMRVVATHLVVPFGEKSRVMLSLRFEGLLGGILGFATRTLNNRYLAMEAQGLKSRVEGLPR